MENKNMEMARRVAALVDEAGGRTYYVGGFVRDRLLGRENKDIDIEIHGVGVHTLEEILDALGERITMGASFGVMGLRHYELDIAMPRSEKATGRGHKDFEVFVDPFLGEEKAASRRDFTMNALMQNVITGDVLDFFGGKEDIDRRVIRHIQDDTFVEDPLRAFRAAQFAARFGFSVAEETTALSAAMDVAALPGERIMMELEKALLKADRPAVFFEEIRKMNQLSVWFPEAERMLGLPHGPGQTQWAHTMAALNRAAALRSEARQPLPFMLSALCQGFEKAGDDSSTIRRFLGRITKETKLTSYVANMAELCGEPGRMMRRGDSTDAFMALFDRCACPSDLLLLAKAKEQSENGGAWDAETENALRGLLAVYEERMSRPFVMGRDLMEAGMKPGPAFSQALACAHRLRLKGLPKEEQLRQTLEWLRRKDHFC